MSAPRDASVGRDAYRATTPSADFYGFDFYTVDLTDDFSPSGQIVEDARAAAPAAEPIAVVQGFGYADMEMALPPATGRRPRAEEVRTNAFMAVAHGARGVFWYGQSALSLADGDLFVWDAIRVTARDLCQLSGICRGSRSMRATPSCRCARTEAKMFRGSWRSTRRRRRKRCTSRARAR